MGSQIGGQLWKSGAQAPTVVGGKTFTPVAYYPSTSNPKKGHTVCEVSDGSVSCNCLGWTRRNPPGGRTCKHTEDYLMYLKPARGAIEQIVEHVQAEQPQPAHNREQGGTLTDLFNKLDKESNNA